MAIAEIDEGYSRNVSIEGYSRKLMKAIAETSQ